MKRFIISALWLLSIVAAANVAYVRGIVRGADVAFCLVDGPGSRSCEMVKGTSPPIDIFGVAEMETDDNA